LANSSRDPVADLGSSHALARVPLSVIARGLQSPISKTLKLRSRFAQERRGYGRR
jgi:hypothetical protein